MADYVPSNDVTYRDWLNNFVSVLTAHLLDVGLTAPDIAPLDGLRLSYEMSLGDYQAKKTASQSAGAVKKVDRDATETTLRPLVRRIQNHPGMTNELRVELRLPERSNARLTSGTVGDEIPGIMLETSPEVVIVHFGTNPKNEQLNGKPYWARGCNIYRKKEGEDDFTLIAFETASPFEDEITAPAAAYTYYVQYRGTRASDVGRSSAPDTVAASGLLAA